MTVVAWGRRRRFPGLPAPEERLFRVTPDTQVLAHCHWQRDRARHPLLIALHGLEGSTTAHYMRGLAAKGHHAGFNVLLLNQRNCGGTEHLGPGLYHSGLTDDAIHVMQEVVHEDGITRIVVAGYSLGGNLALKLAGDFGEAAPSELRGVCAVSPVMDPSRCVHALERRSNFIYQWNFVRGLRARMRRKEALHPGRFDLTRLGSIRTVREFDDVYTAPYFGFQGAEDYYHRASALRVVDRIRVPALIITSEDDPFVPSEPFRDTSLSGNPNIELLLTNHGGHCAFVSEPSAGSDGYWAEDRIIDYTSRVTRELRR
jgi:predicted alpha/beta-fold hydrolase